MVDEAHSLGVLGKRAGHIEHWNVQPNDIDFCFLTLVKHLQVVVELFSQEVK